MTPTSPVLTALILGVGALFLAAVIADVIAGIAGKYPARTARSGIIIDLLLVALLAYGIWWVAGR